MPVLPLISFFGIPYLCLLCCGFFTVQVVVTLAVAADVVVAVVVVVIVVVVVDVTAVLAVVLAEVFVFYGQAFVHKTLRNVLGIKIETICWSLSLTSTKMAFSSTSTALLSPNDNQQTKKLRLEMIGDSQFSPPHPPTPSVLLNVKIGLGVN